MIIICSDVAVLEEDSPAMQFEARDRTIEELLQWARERRKYVIMF